MEGRLGRNEELCPECGHLLPTKEWSCQFCGWNIDRERTHAYEADFWNDYSGMNNMSRIDIDVEQLMANA